MGLSPHDMFVQARRGGGSIDQPFRNFGIKRSWWLEPRPGLFSPVKKPDTHCARVWADLGKGRRRTRKSWTLPEFDPRTVQHVSSRCNDYAILGTHIWDESAHYIHYATCHLLDLCFLLSLLWVVFIRCCVFFINAMFVTPMVDERMWRHWPETIGILGEEIVRPILRLQQAKRLPWKRGKSDSLFSPEIPLRTSQQVLEQVQQSNYSCLISVYRKRHTVAHVAFSQLCLRAIVCKKQDEVELKSK
jgi:hypothetical protein